MPARRSPGLALLFIVAVTLLIVPALVVGSGALDGEDGLERWAGSVLFRLGLGDGSRLVVSDERGELEVHVVHDEVVRVLLDGDDVPAERMLRDGDRLVVLRPDGTEWGEVSLDLEREDARRAREELEALAEGLQAEVRRLRERLADDVATRMAAALAALDPPLPPPVHARLEDLARRAAAACMEEVDRTIIGQEPDAQGVRTWRVEFDRDDLVDGFADAFEDALVEAGTPLAKGDVQRVRRALSRASFDLPELEYRFGP
jgi:hypothetical protein